MAVSTLWLRLNSLAQILIALAQQYLQTNLIKCQRSLSSKTVAPMEIVLVGRERFASPSLDERRDFRRGKEKAA
jgi:hypothetical protein